MSKFKSVALPALALAILAASAAASAQTVLTVSSWVPPAHTLTESQKEWCTMLEQKAPGKIKCNYLPRAVSAPPGTFDAVRNGLADLSFTVQGYTPGRFVTTQIAEFPFLGDSAEATSVAFQRVYAKTPAMAEEHKGVKVLAVFTHGPGIVFNTKRPIASVADLSGLKFRIGGGMVNEITKALGMNVTLKPAPESYELLSSGVMDGTLFPAESVEGFKIDKIIKYATTFPGGLYNTSLRVHDEPGQVRQPAAGREEDRRRDVRRVCRPHDGQGLGQGRPSRYGPHAGQRRAVHQGRRGFRQEASRTRPIRWWTPGPRRPRPRA